MYMKFFWLLRSLLQPYFVFFSILSVQPGFYYTHAAKQHNHNLTLEVSLARSQQLRNLIDHVIDPVRQCNLGRNCFSQLGDVLNNIYETLSWSCSICTFISTPGSNPFLVPITINSDFSHSRSTFLTKLRGEILQIFIYKYLQIETRAMHFSVVCIKKHQSFISSCFFFCGTP